MLNLILHFIFLLTFTCSERTFPSQDYINTVSLPLRCTPGKPALYRCDLTSSADTRTCTELLCIGYKLLENWVAVFPCPWFNSTTLIIYIEFRIQCDGIFLLIEKFSKNVMRVDFATALSLRELVYGSWSFKRCTSGYCSISCLVKCVVGEIRWRLD